MKKTIGSIFSLVLAVSVMMYGCGDKDIAPTITGTKIQASKAASKTVSQALGSATFSTTVGSKMSKPSSEGVSSGSDPKSIGEALANFKASLKTNTNRQKPLYEATATTTPTTVEGPCTGGGTQRVIIYPNSNIDVTYSDCKETEDQIESLKRGRVEMTVTSLSPIASSTDVFQIKFTNYFERNTDKQTKRVMEETDNGTIAFTGDEVICTRGAIEQSFLASGTITLTNFTGSEKEDETGDGTFERNESSAHTDLKLEIAETSTDCVLSKATVKLKGSETLTDNIDAKKSYTAIYDGLTIVETPTTRVVSGETLSGNAVSINGTVTFTACGTSATITFVTETDPTKVPFVPNGKECPVNGRVLVTTAGVTSAVIATPTGGVEIDEGNDGSIEHRFKKCQDADGCV